jgi:DNA-binding transcriptional regulator YiaG
MPPEELPNMKCPFNAARAFPWRCHHCGKDAVVMATVEYNAEVRHDGRLHAFTIPALSIPVCNECGEKVFTENVDEQVNDALRLHLNVLTPPQIRDALHRVRLSQKEVAERLGIAEATLSRWLNETQIQAKSLDRFLRVFFAFPQVRAALSERALDSEFGTSDITDQDCVDNCRSNCSPTVGRAVAHAT